MKRKLLLVSLILSSLIAVLTSCHDHDLDIAIRDDDSDYRMRIWFEEDQTLAVQRVINEHLRQHHSISLVHGYTDTDVTLDDGTVFHIKSRPGRLRINFDKDGNSEEGCDKVMEMCDEIKDMLAREEDQNNN